MYSSLTNNNSRTEESRNFEESMDIPGEMEDPLDTEIGSNILKRDAEKQVQKQQDRNERIQHWYLFFVGLAAFLYTLMSFGVGQYHKWKGYLLVDAGVPFMLGLSGLMWLNLISNLIMALSQSVRVRWVDKCRIIFLTSIVLTVLLTLTIFGAFIAVIVSGFLPTWIYIGGFCNTYIQFLVPFALYVTVFLFFGIFRFKSKLTFFSLPPCLRRGKNV